MTALRNTLDWLCNTVGMLNMQRTFVRCTAHVPYPLVVNEMFISLVPVMVVGDLALFGMIAFFWLNGAVRSEEFGCFMAVAGFTGVMRSLKIWQFLGTSTPVHVPAPIMEKFRVHD